MSWLNILLALIKYGPQAFHLISEIIDLLRGVQDPQAKEGLKVELKSAVAVAKGSGDRRPLRDLRDRLYRRRDGDRPGPRAA
jgi:hypothetical protein